MKILVADDHHQNRYLLEQLLGGLGHEVVSTPNGREALNKLQQGGFDAVISDILMPEMDGFQLCREIRSSPALHALPFIFYTATYTDAKDEKFAHDLGADGFLVKPMEPEAFVQRVFEMLRRAAENPARGGQSPSDTQILTTYNQRLIDKLESKIGQLERARNEAEEAHRTVRSLNAELTSALVALRESEARFREVFQNSSDCIAIFGVRPGDRFVYEGINRAAETLKGVPNESVWGRSPDEVLPPDRAAFINGLLRRVAASGEPVTIDDSFTLRDELVTFSALYVPIRDAEGRVHRIASICRDLTAMRKAAEHQRVLEEQLFQSQKMEALGTLAGGIAHDFNNVIGAIMGNAEMASMDLPADHPAAEFVSEIHYASLRARDLVQQILSFSRRRDRPRQPTSLAEAVRGALRLIEKTLSPEVKVLADLDEACPPVLADPAQLHQVVMNLVANGAQAMPPGGGQVTVSIRAVDILPGPANRGYGLEPGRYVRLTVADTGMGMDEKTVARAFEPFFTTKDHGKGTGLGLAVVHGIVKSHEGAISVESAPGKGTRFDLHFPASAESALPDRPLPPRVQQGNRERILFIDDEEPLVRNARRMLEPRNFRFFGYTDPESALRDFRKAPGDYDVVVTDIVMPKLGGLQLARQIRALRSDLPIIFVTGFSQDLTVELIRELGVDCVLQKPHTLAELMEAVRQALQLSRKPS